MFASKLEFRHVTVVCVIRGIAAIQMDETTVLFYLIPEESFGGEEGKGNMRFFLSEVIMTG